MLGSLKRQGSLDALRGLAALQVMTTHYISTFYPYAVFGDRGGYVKKSIWEGLLFFPPFGLLTAGNFAVCLFFVLSGYVLSHTYLGERHRFQDITAAMVKRPIRLGGLVLFTVLVSALLWAAGCYFNAEASGWTGSRPWFDSPWHGPFDARKMLMDIGAALFTQAGFYNPPLWTIKIELYGSMYVFVFLMVFGACRYRLAVILLLLLALRNSPYFGFFAGVLLADLVKNHASTIRSARWKAWGAFAVIGAIYFSSYPGYVGAPFLQGTIYDVLPARAAMFVGYPMLGAILVFGLVLLSGACQRLLMRPAMLWLGRVSYAVYALHFLLLGSWASWLFLALQPWMAYGHAVLLVLVTSLPLTFWLAHWVTILVDLPATKLGQQAGHRTAAGIYLIARKLGIHGRGH
jgi:peptidoglycan/LPS O-acetylase OafA/YrhL